LDRWLNPRGRTCNTGQRCHRRLRRVEYIHLQRERISLIRNQSIRPQNLGEHAASTGVADLGAAVGNLILCRRVSYLTGATRDGPGSGTSTAGRPEQLCRTLGSENRRRYRMMPAQAPDVTTKSATSRAIPKLVRIPILRFFSMINIYTRTAPAFGCFCRLAENLMRVKYFWWPPSGS